MTRTLEPVVMDESTDWTGQILPRQMIDYITVGCIVRVVVKNREGAAEAIYFEITKIKDGTFWGIAQDIYRLWDSIGLANGEQMTFRKEHVNEIPLDWQPKRFQKDVAHLTGRVKDHGYLTGVRYM